VAIDHRPNYPIDPPYPHPATAAAGLDGLRRSSGRRSIPVNKDYAVLDTHGPSRKGPRRAPKKDKEKEKAKKAAAAAAQQAAAGGGDAARRQRLLQEQQQLRQQQQQQQQQYAAYHQQQQQQHHQQQWAGVHGGSPAAQQVGYPPDHPYAAYYQQQHQAYYAAYYQQQAAAAAAAAAQQGQHHQQQGQGQQTAAFRYEYVPTADPHADSLLWAGALLDKGSGDVTLLYEVLTLAESEAAGQQQQQQPQAEQQQQPWALTERLHLEACRPPAAALAPPAQRAARYLRLRHAPRALAAVARKADVLLAANGRALVGPQPAVAAALAAGYEEGGLRRLRCVVEAVCCCCFCVFGGLDWIGDGVC